jgi:hypothetical protein
LDDDFIMERMDEDEIERAFKVDDAVEEKG